MATVCSTKAGGAFHLSRWVYPATHRCSMANRPRLIACLSTARRTLSCISAGRARKPSNKRRLTLQGHLGIRSPPDECASVVATAARFLKQSGATLRTDVLIARQTDAEMALQRKAPLIAWLS